jgi:hypothetical protein
MQARNCRLAAILALAATSAPLHAAGEFVCPVTQPPNPAFVPPPPYKLQPAINGSFYIGTPGLWAQVITHWSPGNGRKLPYFRQGFDMSKENDPRMVVVARRLDKSVPLVWANWVNSGRVTSYPVPEGDFIVTGVGDLDRGCWEIAARYFPTRDNVQTLTYTVLVE